MRSRFACLLVIAGLAFWPDVAHLGSFPRAASASTVIELSLADLVRLSTVAAIGAPVEQTSVWEDLEGDRGRRIVTYTRVEVEQVVFGPTPPQRQLWVRTLGGQVGDIGQHVDGEAILVPAQSSLMFLFARDDGTHSLVGMAQGHFPLIAARSGDKPRIFLSPSVGRLVPRLGGSPGAPAPARAALDGKTLDEAVGLIRAAWRNRAR